MTLIETAKRNGLDVYGYLMYLLTALPALGKEPSEESLIPLLPWSDSLPDYCKAVYDEIPDRSLWELLGVVVGWSCWFFLGAGCFVRLLFCVLPDWLSDTE